MKQLLFLLLFPCFAVAQYQGNGNQKITLGEQTTADGLVYRGLASDTTRKPSVDTMAYILLDTNTNIIWQYKKATSNAWTRVGGSISSGLTGVLPVANGGTGTSIGSIIGSDSLLFAAGGSNKNIRVTPSGTGNFVVTNGNIVLANNAGIDFGVTTNSSGTMENELLDDYEEGYFTYTMPCSTSGSFTPRSGYLTGYYTKIGRVVNIHVRFESLGRNSPVGSIQLGNLPFTTASDPTNGFGLFIFPVFFQGFNNTGIGSTYFKVFKNDTKGVFTRQSTAGVVDDIVVADITTNYEGSLIFSYVTN